jgi:high-affinity nickel-transport protein
MISALSTIILGFLLGMRHATDPDHVVAVATIVSREQKLGPAAWIGALWGAGHTVTIAAVGGAIILFNWVVPPRVGLLMELAVGVMLIILGLLNVSGAGQVVARLRTYQIVRPFFVGIIHGLAGSAAVALVVLTTIRRPSWAVAYLLVFGVGTVAGMALVTTAIAAPIAYSTRRFEIHHQSKLQLATGMLSVAFGLFLVYKIGYVDGLFSAEPVWIPD